MIEIAFRDVLGRAGPDGPTGFDDPFFDFENAEGLAHLAVDGREFLFVTSGAGGDYVASIALAPDGTMTPAGLVVNDVRSITAVDAAVIGGRPLVVTAGEGRLTVYALDPETGAMTVISDLAADTFFAVSAIRFVEAHGEAFVVVAAGDENVLSLVSLDETGAPAEVVQTIEDGDLDVFTSQPVELSGAQEIEVTQVGLKTFLHIGNASGQGLTTLELQRLDFQGRLRLVEVFEDAQHDLDDGLAQVDFGDRRYLVGVEDEDLIVLEVGHDGRLSVVDRIEDVTPFFGAIGVAAVVVDGVGYVGVSGSDDVTLYEMGRNGRLRRLDGQDNDGLPARPTDDSVRDGVMVAAEDGVLRWINAHDDVLRVEEGGETQSVPGLVSLSLSLGPNLTFDPDAPLLSLPNGPRLQAGEETFFDDDGLVNDGDRDAQNVAFAVYASADQVLDADDQSVFFRFGGQLRAGEATQPLTEAPFFSLDALPAGDVFLIGVADEGANVEESDETDNLTVMRVQVTPFTGGDDVIRLPGPSAFEWRALGGDDQVTGTDGRDRVAGGAGADVLIGEAGADTLKGGRGTDTLSGAGAADQLLGGRGGDVLFGGGGGDLLRGGGGGDRLSGLAGQDRLEGGGGR
ncbi:MAG: hypothetical protein AAFU61_09340, partial [Pseudomonadota bacterium]